MPGEVFRDLLLFNVEQLRYVVVELKIGSFDPAYVGQLGTYVAVVDDRLRRADRHAHSGILLCKGATTPSSVTPFGLWNAGGGRWPVCER